MDQEQAKVGKLLFGRPSRLAIGLHLFRHNDDSYLTEIMQALGLPLSVVAQELARLHDLGMLTKVGAPGDRRIWYRRTDSPWWAVFAAADRALESSDDGDDGTAAAGEAATP